MQHRLPLVPYSSPRIILHWISAAVIIWATCSGFLAVAQAPNSPVRQMIDAFNPQLATLFIPLFAVRLVLYLQSRPWRAWRLKPAGDNVAALGHGLLYLCITLVLTTGLFLMPRPWMLLGVLRMPAMVQNQHDLAWLGAAHGGLCTFLALLVVGHIGAVFWHQTSGHPVLNRMILRRAIISRGPRKNGEAVEAEAIPQADIKTAARP